MNFLKSLKNAFKGILYCIHTERNMRIHTVAALYVLIFSKYFNLSTEKYSILLLIIGLIFSFELLNTGVEKMTDTLIDKYNINVKIIKDLFAGSVLILAIISIVIGILFFGNLNTLCFIFFDLIKKPFHLVLLFASIFISILYIKVGPLGIKNQYKKFLIKR